MKYNFFLMINLIYKLIFYLFKKLNKSIFNFLTFNCIHRTKNFIIIFITIFITYLWMVLFIFFYFSF